MPPPLPVAGLPAPDPEAVASAWLAGLLAGAPLAAAPRIASEDFAAAAPGIAAACAAALGAPAAFGGPDGPGEGLARLAAPVPPGGAAAVVAAGEALRGALGGVLASALLPVPEAAAPLHDRLAWAVAELVRAALAEPEVTDARPTWTVVVELDDADRLAGAGEHDALAAAERALRAALPAGARCGGDGAGRWRVTGAGGGAGTAAAGGPSGVAAALVAAIAGVPGPHGVPLRARAGAGASADEADGRLLAARAEGVPVLPAP